MDDVLANRYATRSMATLWSDAHRYALERRLWYQILSEQRNAGMVTVSDEQMARYEAAVGDIRMSVIESFERKTRHDLQARLLAYEFAAAKPVDGVVVPDEDVDEENGKLHLGLTSSDITENTTCILIRDGLMLIHRQIDACVFLLLALARHYAGDYTVGRTHGVPAQLTTIGARYARYAYELREARARVADAELIMPMRGLGGAVGTSADMLILAGDPLLVAQVESGVVNTFGFGAAAGATGQVGYRSVDLDVASALLQVCAVPANVALGVRLQTMLGTVLETPPMSDQVGSSAMAHKINPRFSERICGLQVVARGYHAMIVGTAGNTWFEGDVSDSCVRRIAWPGLMLTVSGVLRNLEYVLRRVVHDVGEELDEAEHYALEINTGALLSYALLFGGDRTAVHKALRDVCAAGTEDNKQFAENLAAHPDWPNEIGRDAILGLLGRRDTGLAWQQATDVQQEMMLHAGYVLPAEEEGML